MNHRIIRWGVALLVLTVTLCSFTVTASDSTAVDTAGTDMAVADSALNDGSASLAADSENATADTDSVSDGEPRSIPWELILSCLALAAAVAVFLLDRQAIKDAKHALDERINQRKTDIIQLEARLNSLDKALPGKIQAILEDQQETFMAEQERKAREMREELAAKEEELRRRQEEAEAASRPYQPKVYYAAYKDSIKGFAVEYLSDERKPNSTAVIRTCPDGKAEFSLVPDLNPTAFRSIIDACEIVKGSPESYSSIEVVEPGRLALDDDAWVIESKVKIACL